MNVLMIDAYDSFIFIIRQYLCQAGTRPTVVRNDKISIADIEARQPDFIVLGPGPGHPADARYVEIIRHFAPRGLPILGVCLGQQAIALTFGGRIEQARQLMHGKISDIDHDGAGVFDRQPQPFKATRYHSLVVADGSVPAELAVTAHARDDGHIMGLRHRDYPIESVQFHPESICTEDGMRLFTNFMARHVAPRDD